MLPDRVATGSIEDRKTASETYFDSNIDHESLLRHVDGTVLGLLKPGTTPDHYLQGAKYFKFEEIPGLDWRISGRFGLKSREEFPEFALEFKESGVPTPALTLSLYSKTQPSPHDPRIEIKWHRDDRRWRRARSYMDFDTISVDFYKDNLSVTGEQSAFRINIPRLMADRRLIQPFMAFPPFGGDNPISGVEFDRTKNVLDIDYHTSFLHGPRDLMNRLSLPTDVVLP